MVSPLAVKSDDVLLAMLPVMSVPSFFNAVIPFNIEAAVTVFCVVSISVLPFKITFDTAMSSPLYIVCIRIEYIRQIALLHPYAIHLFVGFGCLHPCPVLLKINLIGCYGNCVSYINLCTV